MLTLYVFYVTLKGKISVNWLKITCLLYNYVNRFKFRGAKKRFNLFIK